MYTANVDTLILEDLLTLSITPESVEFESQCVCSLPCFQIPWYRSYSVGVAKKMGLLPRHRQMSAYLSLPSPVLFSQSGWNSFPLPGPRVEALFQLCTLGAENAVSLVLASTCSRIGDASKKWAFIPACISQQWNKSSFQKDAEKSSSPLPEGTDLT